MSGERSIHLPGRPLGILPASLPRSAAAVLLGLLTAAALMVVARRLAGALANPLEPATLLTTGILVAAAAAAIRLGWFFSPAHPRRRLDRAVMVLTSLSRRGPRRRPVPAGYAGGRPVSALHALGGGRKLGLGLAPPAQYPAARPPPPVPAPRLPARGCRSTRTLRFFPEEVTQQLTRSQAADGAEELSGWLRMAFAAGQRTGSLHVAFCPPFAVTPELEVEQLDGPEARIKTAQLLPYGARLDLKLAAAAEEPTSVLLQFSARTAL